MHLKTLRMLTFLSVLLCLASWLATAESLHANEDGIPVRLMAPSSSAPEFLL